jgi:hypothetical protein
MWLLLFGRCSFFADANRNNFKLVDEFDPERKKKFLSKHFTRLQYIDNIATAIVVSAL